MRSNFKLVSSSTTSNDETTLFRGVGATFTRVSVSITQYLTSEGILTIVCLFPIGDSLAITGISIGFWRSNLRSLVVALNYEQSGRAIITLLFKGNLA